jgi:hypothetical protein
VLTLNSIKAQDLELRTIAGVKTEWKGMEFLLINMNFFIPDGTWFQNNTRFTVDFKSKSSFKFGIGYQYEYVERPERIVRESRPMLFLTYTKHWKDFEFRSWSTMEFRIIDRTMRERYRNELQIRFNKWKVAKPFVLTEFFFSVNELEYIRQRTTIGAAIPFKNLTLIPFGFYEGTKVEPKEWSSNYALGVIGIYKFSL